MTGDGNNRGQPDRSKVNVNEPYEVRYWMDRLRCTEEELKNAVRAVGVNVSAVEDFIEKKKRR
ncbi:Mg2+ and Co2+ transporter CorA [Nitrobacteraceae bacterium AZCC 1564]